MKIAVCIQAQDTGRILFIKERQIGPEINWGWTWPETRFHFDWPFTGVQTLTRTVDTYIRVNDLGLEWFNGKKKMNIVHFRVPEERQVFQLPDHFEWRHMFDFPEKVHPFIEEATSDLIFLDSLVSQAT